VGYSAGFKGVAEHFYEAHERPKQLYVRELVKPAARKLWGRQLPEALAPFERNIAPACQMPGGQLTRRWEVLQRGVPESRSGKGLRYRQATMRAIPSAFLLNRGQGGHARWLS
jgi:hypothetical protein